MGYTAIFGGTFNPFHIGHYQMLSALNDSNMVDEILIIPAKNPPHKDMVAWMPDEDRIKVCQLASKQFSKAQTCLLEFQRTGKSYTFETVLRLKEQFPQKSFGVVCGADLLPDLHKWYNFADLSKMVTFLVFKRQGTDDFDFQIRRLSDMGVKFELFDREIPNVSSTEFRFSHKRDLLPEFAYNYIKSRGLYVE